MKQAIRIGAGAGYSGDRIEPAVELAAKGNIQYLVFECLAERTIALAQLQKAMEPNLGYDPLLQERMMACLSICRQKGIKIITNMGAANPLAAMHKTEEIARELGLENFTIAAIAGDDVLPAIQHSEYTILETGDSFESIRDKVVSANAYLGAAPIVQALRQGADVVITGRVADPALFLAPLINEFDWAFNNYDMLGQGTVLGHLMECAGQVCGGYFADPGVKVVPGLENLGFPIAEASPDGSFFITKIPEAGGMVTPATCKEQLLYEIHDPSHYLTPDVIADFAGVTVTSIGKDKVAIQGGKGKPKTGQLKVSVGYQGGFIGEGQISYGGPGAVQRAQLAMDIVRLRLKKLGLLYDDNRFDLIGVDSLFAKKISQGNPYEVRVRVAVRTHTLQDAVRIGNEVEALYTNGPAGGGGATKSARQVIAVASVLIDEKLVQPTIHFKSIP